MKTLFTILFISVLSLGFSQTTVYTTGQTYTDAWTGWSTPVTTNISSSSVNGANVYSFSGTSSNAYTLEIKRQFTISSSDIDIYLAATTQNADVYVEYSTDDVSYTQIGAQNWPSGFAQSTLVIPTWNPGASTFWIKIKMAGTFGSPSSAQLNNLKIDADLSSSSVSVFPASQQTIAPGANGTTLTATETPSGSSREWKYSTTSGSGYVSFASPETALTYVPNFASAGTYYVICESMISGSPVQSNEVTIVVMTGASIIDIEYSYNMTYSNSILNVNATNADYMVSIYNVTGQLIHQEAALTEYTFFEKEHGVYFVSIESKNGYRKTIKVVNAK